MKKRVNVHAPIPVTTLKYPIAGSVRNVMMDVADIRLCLCGKAKVEEILPSGKTVRLGFNNYDKENTVPTDSRVTNQPVQPHVPVEAAKAKAEEEAKAAEEAKAEEVKAEEAAAEEAKAEEVVAEEKKEEAPEGGKKNKKKK